MLICLARKDVIERETGLAIDSARIPTDEILRGGRGILWSHQRDCTVQRARTQANEGLGRYPHNVLIHDVVLDPSSAKFYQHFEVL